MTRNIIFAGVGGQGILSIATIIGDAATRTGINLKQAEVHGMSQRGGDVQSNMRLSTEKIWSDLIPEGEADIIISMEPMEAMRYLPFLEKEGWIITSTDTFRNIPTYPEDEAVLEELHKIKNLVALPIENIAKENSMPKCANVILLGMASKYISIISRDELRQSIINVFERKGESIVEMNLKAFDLGVELAQ
ncbi:indolepyruvate oxidoreductase subunit beta [Phocaeicola paurosaccharolyticus]|uniref:indolepyruvate oxidoreductase subunit beta n=1 Tax=Phocaeicola paurosaccharolyticus TaxID=732242 RepID=UPI002FE13726